MAWNTIPDEIIMQQTAEALKANGIETIIVDRGDQARQKVLELLPEGAEVMTMSSATLDTLGIVKDIDESENYDAIKPKLRAMNRQTQVAEMKKLDASPTWAVGSVHAVTQDGHVVIASNSGSQLPAYVSGALHVIWVVGAQKIVKNTDKAIARIYEYCLPHEDARMKKFFGPDKGSAVNKLVIINREIMPGRLTMILVKEVLGV